MGFKKFKSKLANSATKIKGESLIKQAKSVNVKSTQISQRVHEIAASRNNGKQASIEEKLATIYEDRAAFTEMYYNLKGAEQTLVMFTKNTKENLLQEFEEAVTSGKSEKEAVKELLNKVNDNTKDTISSTRKKVRAVVEKWTENVESSFDVNMSEIVSDDCPHLEEFETLELLEEGLYRRYIDPHYYYTNNYLYGGMFVLAAAVSGIASGSTCFYPKYLIDLI